MFKMITAKTIAESINFEGVYKQLGQIKVSYINDTD